MNLEELDSDEYANKFSDYFEYKSTVGKGAFGVVVAATSKADDKTYAIKIIKKQNLSTSNWNRVRQESELLASLNHNNIVKFKETIETDKRILMVMELIKGGQLRELIEMRRESRKKFTDEEASVIMKSILTAVQYLHSKEIVHRDLKPENILIKDWNDLSSIKIADFGLSAQFSGDFSTQNFRQKCGTVIYMAPEQASEKIYSKPVDIWSCGLIMYILLSNGKHPLYTKDDNPKTYFAKVKNPKWRFEDYFTPLAKSFFLKMMNIDPVIRYTADDALKHPWLTRRFDDPIPLSGHEVMSNFSLEQTFTRIVKAMYLTNFVGSYVGNEATFDDYRDMAEKVSTEKMGSGTRKDTSMLGQYDSLQSLLGIVSPKASSSKPEIRFSSGKKKEANDYSDSSPTIKKIFGEESKMQESHELEENESPLSRRYRKLTLKESDKSGSGGSRRESGRKSPSLRLFTAAAEQQREQVEDVKVLNETVKATVIEGRTLTLTTDYMSNEVVSGMKSFMAANLVKSTRNFQKPNSLFHLDDQEFESEKTLLVPKNNTERNEKKLRAPSANPSANYTFGSKIVASASNFSAYASDESSDGGSVDSRARNAANEEPKKIVKKSPFFHSSQKTEVLNPSQQSARDKHFSSRPPSSRIIFSAKPKNKAALPQFGGQTPKNETIKIKLPEETGLGFKPNTGEKSTRIRFTSQTPSSASKKLNTLGDLPDPKIFAAKTLSTTSKKSLKSIQDVSSLTSLSGKEGFGLGRKGVTRVIRENQTVTSINYL